MFREETDGGRTSLDHRGGPAGSGIADFRRLAASETLNGSSSSALEQSVQTCCPSAFAQQRPTNAKGDPCQMAGLQRCLTRRRYRNLNQVELIGGTQPACCVSMQSHGTPPSEFFTTQFAATANGDEEAQCG